MPPGPQAAAQPPGGNTSSWLAFATRPVDQGGLGLPPHQAAGVVGNLQNESTPNILPTGVVGDSGTAFGAAQWRHDRYANLNNFAKANNMDPRTTEAQQAFMRHELLGSGEHGGGSEARAYRALTAAQDPRSAAAAFDSTYERSSGETRGRREAAAVNLARVLADPNASPRDRVAAIAATRTADTPLDDADVAQESRVADVMGMSRGPTGGYSYPQTASDRTGDIVSDAPQPGITGGAAGPLTGAGIVDTVQQRGNAVQQAAPPTPPPPPPGPQVAQANVFPNPVVAADGRVAPIIPGGGLPAPPAPAIAKAPEPPSAQIRSAPEAPQVKPMAPPTAPRLQPMVDDYIRQQATIANDPRLSDTTRAMAMKQIEKRQGQIKAVNDQTLTEYNDYRKRYEDQQTPATVYGNEKLRRELEGEGAVPLTADQRKQFAIPESQPAWLTRRGEIKLGPVGTKVEVNTGDKAQSKGDEKLQEKLSESFIKTFEEGNTAGDEIKQLAEMRALATRVGTGPGTVMKQYLGQWGIKTEGLSEIQALSAGISRLIPAQRVPGSGTSSDFDGGLFKDSVVALSKTPEGNNLIFDTMDGLAKNKLARADVAGRVISGEITRSDGVKEMLGLQREAKDLSDRVKAHLESTGELKTVKPAVPQQVQDDQAREWLKNNPNHPRAGAVRQKLGM